MKLDTKKILHWLIDADMKKVTLANRLGISKSYVSKMLSGERFPPEHILIGLSKITGVSVEDLLS